MNDSPKFLREDDQARVDPLLILPYGSHTVDLKEDC